MAFIVEAIDDEFLFLGAVSSMAVKKEFSSFLGVIPFLFGNRFLVDAPLKEF